MVNFQNWAIQFDDLSFQDGPNRIYDLTKSEYQLTAEQGEIAEPPMLGIPPALKLPV
jgi:hypothetical protein